MDRELKVGIKKLERGLELKDEETMRGRTMGQTYESIEENEDMDVKAAELKKQLRKSRIFSGVLGVLIVVTVVARLLI